MFILEKYTVLALFCCAFLGYGKLWSRLLCLPFIEDRVLRTCLQIAAGMGVFIMAMQLIGMLGLLKKDVIRALFVMGVGLIFLKQKSTIKLTGPTATGAPQITWNAWHGSAAMLLLIAILATTIHRPLAPPIHWDALMYQLPHVREWLSAKQITVNEWLRYPYFPYNFNLLYAAIMSVTGEYDSGLMHALAGWLTAVMVFRFAQNNHSPFAGVLAAGIWISASKWFYATSYVELGLALFLFSAALCFILWMQTDEQQPAMLVASAFFLGLAAGTKYQALIYLPFFTVFALLRERRAIVWLKVALGFLMPCIFWYARNLLLTGNPFNPLAGAIFGYHDWNAEDFRYQMMDLEWARNFPRPEVWLALLSLVFPAAWRDRTTRWLLLLSLYSAVTWYFTSHYDRYLVPQYPVLALLGAIGIAFGLSAMFSFFPLNPLPRFRRSAVAGKVTLGVVLVFLLTSTLPSAVKRLKEVPVDAASRNGYIGDRAQHFVFLQTLQHRYAGEKIYQLGLEGGLFYGPRKMYGDHFGRWRYRDYENLSASALHQKLISEGFDLLATNPAASKKLEEKQDFWKYFSEIFTHDGAKAYRVIKP